jgi:ribosomal protein S18 acetylase RimI-like enzyme
MFTTPSMAARIDRAEGQLCAGFTAGAAADPGLGSFTMPVAGGLAVFVAVGSPVNKMIGIGFDGPPDEGELAAVEARFAALGAPLQAEVSVLAAPETHAILIRRGYEPRGFENQMGRAIVDFSAPLADGVRVDRIGTVDDEWMGVMVEGFTHPDVGGVGGDALPDAEHARRDLLSTSRIPGFCAYKAYLGGVVAGAAAIRVDAGIAQLAGAATLPALRRRGIQTSLLRARLADAARNGCDIAVVTVQPASKSQENVQRQGFSLLYARQLLVKQP